MIFLAGLSLYIAALAGVIVSCVFIWHGVAMLPAAIFLVLSAQCLATLPKLMLSGIHPYRNPRREWDKWMRKQRERYG